MAKSMRSKREKRLRAIRREMVEPLYQKKEEAKLAAQEAALNAPKLPVRSHNTDASSMDLTTMPSSTSANGMDVEMAINDSRKALKPVGKKLKKKIKLAKRKRHGKGKIRRKHNV
ncbi:uncharacterized protein LOC113783257 isoform X3 [Coffea eugenioides]|uniref:uncharacterized protein LOC113783257 isoform X3 n=1 Tax=Coffea eugenioides TaxID=49369 RepID=UPI000F608220|nr:uncharacterized protein LOC113783257 isoform X3 [Coffea eugenioides]